MAGHNKWSKVKHIKGAVDAKRGKIFSKCAMEISCAAKAGGGDVDANARLRQAINHAKAQNMPSDTIERAVKKGTGELAGVSCEEATYEAYAPGGVALLVEVVTDNKNRTAADIRLILSKNHGTFAESGSVAYLFERKGELAIAADTIATEDVFERGIEAGAEDIVSDDESHVVTTAPDQLDCVAGRLREKGIEILSQKLIFQAQTTVEINDAQTAKQVLRIYQLLDDYEDARNVYSNFELSDELLNII